MDVSFTSMIQSDVKARNQQQLDKQQLIEAHLVEKKFSERVIPYSDKLFKKAAIEWLIATDQVSQ